jgi:RNA polymerase sigma factor (sigma-70 family)
LKPDLRELYERYGHAVHRRCRYLLRDDDDARDAMHEVFVRAMKGGFRGDASPLTWLTTIATRHCLNVLRARNAQWHEKYAKAEEMRASASGPALEDKDLARRMLMKLTPDEQLAVVHYYIDEMSQDEAAAACDCSVPTLRKRLARFVELAQREAQR